MTKNVIESKGTILATSANQSLLDSGTALRTIKSIAYFSFLILPSSWGMYEQKCGKAVGDAIKMNRILDLSS